MKIKMKMYLILYLAVVSVLIAQPPPVPVSPGENTISEALMFAYPNDILELAEGEYTETQTLTIGLDITIRGAEGTTVIWNVPSTVARGIDVKANLHLKNIIFQTDTDTLPNRNEMSEIECIWNMHGSVERGQEIEAEKNSIFVDHCQFIGFRRAIVIPVNNETDPAYDPEPPDGKSHPVDTLYVTNCLFYGGGKYKSYRGITVRYGQARVVKIQDCTFWNMTGESSKIYGHEDNTDYMDLLYDHNTCHQLGLPPSAIRLNGVGIYYKNTSANDTIRNSVFGDISDFGIKGADGGFLNMYIDYHIADPAIGWKAGCGVCQPYHYNLNNLGSHCRTVDPMFVDHDNGDFRYQAGSLALTAADDGGPLGSRIQVWNPGTWDHTPSTDVEKKESLLPNVFRLDQNYPNPFNPSTSISYSVKNAGRVSIDVYSITGYQVRTLVSEFQNPGSYTIVWDGCNNVGNSLAGGVYLCKLKSGSNVQTKKMVFLK